MANLVVNIAQSQVVPVEGSSSMMIFDIVDTIFTVLFCIELGMNLFGYWLLPFFNDPWLNFDFFVVAISVASLVFRDLPGVSILRLMRTFRVLRLFNKLKSLRTLINALAASLMAVMNAFLLVILICVIYAILGVELFGDEKPELFGTFILSYWTMFGVSTLDGWSQTAVDLSAGSQYIIDPVVACFFCTFIGAVVWILLPVVVAILLDNFIRAVNVEKLKAIHDEEEARLKELGLSRADQTNPLDPLLEHLSRFKDSDDLSRRAKNLFKVLDLDLGGTLSYTEIHEGLRKMDTLQPRIYLSREDFHRLLLRDPHTAAAATAAVTAGVPPPQLDPTTFERLLREEVAGFVQARVAAAYEECLASEDSDSTSAATLAGIKLLLMRLPVAGTMPEVGGVSDTAAGQGLAAGTAGPSGGKREGSVEALVREVSAARADMQAAVPVMVGAASRIDAAQAGLTAASALLLRAAAAVSRVSSAAGKRRGSAGSPWRPLQRHRRLGTRPRPEYAASTASGAPGGTFPAPCGRHQGIAAGMCDVENSAFGGSRGVAAEVPSETIPSFQVPLPGGGLSEKFPPANSGLCDGAGTGDSPDSSGNSPGQACRACQCWPSGFGPGGLAAAILMPGFPMTSEWGWAAAAAAGAAAVASADRDVAVPGVVGRPRRPVTRRLFAESMAARRSAGNSGSSGNTQLPYQWDVVRWAEMLAAAAAGGTTKVFTTPGVTQQVSQIPAAAPVTSSVAITTAATPSVVSTPSASPLIGPAVPKRALRPITFTHIPTKPRTASASADIDANAARAAAHKRAFASFSRIPSMRRGGSAGSSSSMQSIARAMRRSMSIEDISPAAPRAGGGRWKGGWLSCFRRRNADLSPKKDPFSQDDGGNGGPIGGKIRMEPVNP